jgi:energy-coupling factor transport system permease protein
VSDAALAPGVPTTRPLAGGPVASPTLEAPPGGRARRRGPRGAPATRGLAARRPAAAAAYVGALAFAALVVTNPIQVALVLAIVVAVLTLCGRLRQGLPYARVALAVGLFLAVLNPLFSGGGLDVLWEADLGPLTVTVTVQGIVYGVVTAMRLMAVVLAFALFNVALDPDDQLGLMSRVSFRSGLVLSLASRLFPVLSRDAARIADAQRSRGIELDRGTRRERAVARVPLLRTLLTRSLERSVDIAAAMEARGYGGARRSRWLHRRPWRAADVALAAGAALAALALLAGLATGAVGYDFFPLLDDPWPQLRDAWWLVLLSALVVPAAMVLRGSRR